MLPSGILQETQKESSRGGSQITCHDLSHSFSWRFESLSAVISAFATPHSISLVWIIEQETEVLKQELPIVKE